MLRTTVHERTCGLVLKALRSIRCSDHLLSLEWQVFWCLGVSGCYKYFGFDAAGKARRWIVVQDHDYLARLRNNVVCIIHESTQSFIISAYDVESQVG